MQGLAVRWVREASWLEFAVRASSLHLEAHRTAAQGIDLVFWTSGGLESRMILKTSCTSKTVVAKSGTAASRHAKLMRDNYL